MIQPKTNILSQIQKAFQFIGTNQVEQAQIIFDQLLHEEISDLNTLAQFGKLACFLGEKVHAINALYKVTEAEPENAIYLDLFAQALIDNGGVTKPRELLQKAIELKPDFADPYIRLAALEIDNLYFKEAVPLLEKAVQLKPGEPVAYANIIVALRYTDRHEEALAYAQKLVRLNANNPANYEILGRVLIELGKIDEAIPLLEKAIRLDPTYGPAYNSLVGIKKYSMEDSAFINQCEKALQLSMPAVQRSLIHFSLGKIYDNCKQWDKAFEHFRQGNLLCKPAFEQDKPLVKRLRKIRKSYTKAFIRKTADLGSDSDIPVFVVGMPRSGSTLIEQIISSHPDGAGAGELDSINRIEKILCPDASLPQYHKLLQENLTREIIQEHANDYLKRLRKNRENASRIVDKMPDNFRYLGLINLLFPKAHIIHSIRNPLDTCLSCYFQAFAYLKWAHDLDWIAARYRLYRETMDYWKNTLPAGKIIDISYEDMTENPEHEIRRMLELVELPWDDQCLNFHKKKRAIVTASVWQARQPIYKSSRNRWANYAPFIEGLASKLSDYLSEKDIEELASHGVKIKKKWRLGFGK